MKTVAVQFLDQGFHRVLFNAMPMPVFVVDADVTVLEYNTAAAKLLGRDKSKVLSRRGGELLHCLHATEHPQGCGHAPACAECLIRRSVNAAIKGRPVNREWAKMDLLVAGKSTQVDLRVTSQPVKYDEHQFVLLVLEGLEALAAPTPRAATRATRKIRF